ncbi:hypothetical protein Syun_001876 [Stephania yunnanensis]|uniref:Uncharacterized protein n=1 Tax=Stephania yunnanensis TaxID=152371 RepID=A0AAP0QBC5_9MAGN
MWDWWEVGIDGGRHCCERRNGGRRDWWETTVGGVAIGGTPMGEAIGQRRGGGEASTGWRGWWEAKAIVGGGNGRRRWDEVNMCDIAATSEEREAFSGFMAAFILILPLKSG